MENWLDDLGMAIPSTVAVLVVVTLFLRFLREERTSRDQQAQASHAVLEKLRDSMAELAQEIRQSIR